MRIAHYLARCGAASRRKAEEFVSAGRVSLNEEIITDLGRQVEPGQDAVTLDGKPLVLPSASLTLLLNKPPEVMVTRDDPQGRPTIYDLLPAEYQPRASELVYAGRLDYLTAGLLVLTTDGELVNHLTHPRHALPKTYEVEVDAPLTEEQLTLLREGVDIGDGVTLPAEVRVASKSREDVYSIVLREGRNRQIRRMIQAIGRRVVRLRRTAIGPLRADLLRLREGQIMELNAEQVSSLLQGGSPT
ncbi:pseudouridine synthase [soil metagenome]